MRGPLLVGLAFLLAGVALAAEVTCDVAVVGGGSAGFAAALAAAEKGADVLLVEKEKLLGGTSTIGGVNCWEPVCGATGTPRRVYERLRQIPQAAGVYGIKHHCCWPENGRPCTFPGAWCATDPALGYDSTLRRHGPGLADEKWFRANCHGVVFEPEAMAKTMRTMLDETGRCRVLTGVAFVRCTATNGVVSSLTLSNGLTVRPKVVVDTTGLVAAQAGAPVLRAEHPNGATLIYRVSPKGDGLSVPADVPERCWWRKDFPVASCVEYPCGDLNVNMLPTMDGDEAVRLGAKAVYEECRRRVFAHWRWMQRKWPAFRDWKLKSIAPVVAYRETIRIGCEYMLTGDDVANGRHFPDEIACADHALDTHGRGGVCGEVKAPYGIPLRALRPKGLKNVLVAGRIAGFDEQAASSCRLSRTMMQLGEAAGRAAW